MEAQRYQDTICLSLRENGSLFRARIYIILTLSESEGKRDNVF